ncbi:MAG: NYN domain-containing protein [Candidatus Vogelbacteria bacterium]|nr:NYN domain-containing protein [Candidatus Vogelbacteria bacterium]
MKRFSNKNNYAYIDGANLYKGVSSLGWKLDYARFRVWLGEKYKVSKACIFIGLIPDFKDLYRYFQESGFILVYKEVIYDQDGKPKGNCDADLVLQVACDTYENKYEKAVIVSSDGDYAGLVKFLQLKEKIIALLSPAKHEKCSILLKRTGVPISYIADKKLTLEVHKEKAPDRDRTL